MNKTAKILVALLVVAVVAGGAVLLARNKSDKNKSGAGTTSSQTSQSPNNSGEAAVTITYNGSNFELSSNSVKSGEKVKVVNSSQSDLQFDSDPHPVHTDDPELNAGAIAPGESKTFTLTTKGTWGFHNHLDSSQHGEITVE